MAPKLTREERVFSSYGTYIAKKNATDLWVYSDYMIRI